MRAGLSVPFFGIVATLAGLLVFVLVLHNDAVDASRAPHVLSPRQASSAAANTSPAAATSQATSTPQQPASSNTPAASSSPQQQASTTPSNPSSTAQQSTSQAAQSTSTPTNAPATTSSTPTVAPVVTSAVVTTNSGGQVVTSVVFVSDSSSSSASPSGTAASSKSSGSDSGISTSTIIGLSVAGGVAVLCVVGFFVWKFTRKRLGDFENNEEIKWPELNTHDTSVPLPTNRTGGAGFDTAPDAARRSSVGYASSTAANSTAELHPDPYAIPPLPHLDPNQPYRDDPNTTFYDPYRGPLPPSFEQTIQGGEVIPMTQLAGRRSPGPGPAYGGDFGSGRISPGPPAAYGMDFGGRASPGPRAPYAGGRMSPGPQAAYGNAYGPR